jgi:protein-S-isoprenylcysteine O-methyltransferase Ste14
MITWTAFLVVLVVLFTLGLFFARRILRLAIKLAFVGAVLFALFAAGIWGWWRGWFEMSSARTHPPAINSNQSRNTNRKPAR